MMMREPKHPGGLYLRLLSHAALAGVFFFVLQRYAMGETLETSLLWGAFFAAAAALLAWHQSRR